MESIKDLTNPNSFENREKIAAVILQDTGDTDIYNAADATLVRVNYGNIIGNGNNDAVVTVCFGSDDCLMTVYTLGENGYEYSGEVGHFFGVDNIKTFRPNGAAKDVILFRERSNQSIGALENSSILRAYSYLDGNFKNVLSFDENLESWWNDCYHEGVRKWCRVIQTSKVNTIEDYRTITVVKDQIFSTSEKQSSRIRPVDSDFAEQSRRTITETYHWDNDWGLYMLAKKTEKRTGEVVAVLQDYGNSPYVLSGDIFDKYKILRDDGSVSIVDYIDLEDIPQNTETTAPGPTTPRTTTPGTTTPGTTTPGTTTPGTMTPGTTTPGMTTPGTTTPRTTTPGTTTPGTTTPGTTTPGTTTPRTTTPGTMTPGTTTPRTTTPGTMTPGTTTPGTTMPGTTMPGTTMPGTTTPGTTMPGTTMPGTMTPGTTMPEMTTPEMTTPRTTTPGTTTPGTTTPGTTTPGTTMPGTATPGTTTPANNRSANNRWYNNRRPNNRPR